MDRILLTLLDVESLLDSYAELGMTEMEVLTSIGNLVKERLNQLKIA